VGYFVRPPRLGRHDGCFAEVATDLLTTAGVPVELHNRSRWLGQVHDAYHRVEDDIIATSPDVVVLCFGWLECQPKVFPTALLRWLTTYRPRYTWAFPARRWAARRIAKVYVRLTPAVAQRWRGLPSRMSERRFRQELERLVQLCRKETASLVVLLTVNPPTDRIEAVLPTVGERSGRYADIVRQVAAGAADEQVRLLDTRALVLEHGQDAVLPDGIHFNAEGHRLVGEALTAEVSAWLRSPLRRPVAEGRGQAVPPGGDRVGQGDVEDVLDDESLPSGQAEAGGGHAGGLVAAMDLGEVVRGDANHDSPC
jgi:lysophospholipase L1-like esterase